VTPSSAGAPVTYETRTPESAVCGGSWSGDARTT